MDTTPYNHYSLLRSIERNWSLPYLGDAGQQGLQPLGRKMLDRPRLQAAAGGNNPGGPNFLSIGHEIRPSRRAQHLEGAGGRP